MKAVCIADDWRKLNNWTHWQTVWFFLTGKRPIAPGPKKGETLVVLMTGDGPFGPCLWFMEYGLDNGYTAGSFRPLDPLEEQLAEIEQNHVVEPEPELQPA